MDMIESYPQKWGQSILLHPGLHQCPDDLQSNRCVLWGFKKRHVLFSFLKIFSYFPKDGFLMASILACIAASSVSWHEYASDCGGISFAMSCPLVSLSGKGKQRDSHPPSQQVSWIFPSHGISVALWYMAVNDRQMIPIINIRNDRRVMAIGSECICFCFYDVKLFQSF